MEAYLSKALRRAGIKLTLGLAVIGALVGIRIVTATPTGVEGEIAELERFEAELASAEVGAAAPADGEPGDAATTASAPAIGSAPRPSGAGRASPGALDLDRMVRCLGGGTVQYMRAADCATRGGDLEELPPPEPEAGDAPSQG
jgi:hypothetical protein